MFKTTTATTIAQELLQIGSKNTGRIRLFSNTSITSASTSNKKTIETIKQIELDWKENPRWNGIVRRYTGQDVERLRGSLLIEHTLAKRGALKLWKLMNETPYVKCLGAMSGNQAMQQVKAGLPAVYVSGWQVASDANLSGEMYPDQSLYPANSVPNLVKSINKTLTRADQIYYAEGAGDDRVVDDWFVPLMADAEAGFGGILNAYELMKSMIEAGASGVHFEDQLASAKKCGHMGGKVLVPTSEAIDKLIAARLAADVLNVPTILVARTDAEGGALLTSDIDSNDRQFITGDRTPEGFYRTRPGIEQSISRGLAYSPFADVLWCETSTPNLNHAKQFANAIHTYFPGKLLAYNCSPSFNWKKNLTDNEITNFQKSLGALGYKFQFITLAGFHSLNYGMFDLSLSYCNRGMPAFVDLQQKEFVAQEYGFTAVKHQREVGTGYFDTVANIVQQGQSSTVALKGSTEEEQFINENNNTEQKFKQKQAVV